MMTICDAAILFCAFSGVPKLPLWTLGDVPVLASIMGHFEASELYN